MIVQVCIAIDAQGAGVSDGQAAGIAQLAFANEVKRTCQQLQLPLVAGTAGDTGGDRLMPGRLGACRRQHLIVAELAAFLAGRGRATATATAATLTAAAAAAAAGCRSTQAQGCEAAPPPARNAGVGIAVGLLGVLAGGGCVVRERRNRGEQTGRDEQSQRGAGQCGRAHDRGGSGGRSHPASPFDCLTCNLYENDVAFGAAMVKGAPG